MTKTIQIFSILVVSIITFFSCVDLETEKETLSDVYITTKINNGDTVYLLEGFVQSNYSMKSVILKNPDKSITYDFTKSSSSGGYFQREVTNEDYTLIKPASGNYTFDILYDDGTAVETIDFLTSDVIEPIKITEVIPDSINLTVVVSWIKNTKADYYTVRILNKESIIFLSDMIDSTYSSVTIFTYSYGWSSSIIPEDGDSLQVVISGIQRDSGDSKYLEIQSLSSSLPVGFVWTE
jgi:hypothetical protein